MAKPPFTANLILENTVYLRQKYSLQKGEFRGRRAVDPNAMATRKKLMGSAE